MEALIALLQADETTDVRLNVIKVNSLSNVRLLTVKVCHLHVKVSTLCVSLVSTDCVSTVLCLSSLDILCLHCTVSLLAVSAVECTLVSFSVSHKLSHLNQPSYDR